MTDKKWSYFQYVKALDLPIYVRVDLDQFDKELVNSLHRLQFELVPSKDHEKIEQRLQMIQGGRMLTLRVANPRVAQQIRMHLDSDKYGEEQISPKVGYKLYRYRNLLTMVYSFAAKEWELGAFEDLGRPKNFEKFNIAFHRFLSWALAPLGIVGFWAVPVDEGYVVMNQLESKGEAVFFDLIHQRVLTWDGVQNFTSEVNILRLDPTLVDRTQRMKLEELLGFLSFHCVYFDFDGIHYNVKKAVQDLALIARGTIHPTASFKPRTDLSA